MERDLTTTILTVAVLGLMASRLVGGVRVARSTAGRALVRRIVTGIRWRHLWPVPFVIAAVVAAAMLLTAVPVLGWGWWSALGGAGNPALGMTDTTAGTAWEWLLPLVFLAMLIPALPLFAHAEERWFRSGAEEWSWPRRAWRTLLFGLVHAVVGIPIGAALALSIGGAWFLRVYLREYRRTGSRRAATLESATAHTAYNGVIISVVLVVLVLTALS